MGCVRGVIDCMTMRDAEIWGERSGGWGQGKKPYLMFQKLKVTGNVIVTNAKQCNVRNKAILCFYKKSLDKK